MAGTAAITGEAQSVQISSNGRPIGGLYGPVISGRISSESMFNRERNLSNLAPVDLARWLVESATRIDCRFLTPRLGSPGVHQVVRQEYVSVLRHDRDRPITLFAGADPNGLLARVSALAAPSRLACLPRVLRVRSCGSPISTHRGLPEFRRASMRMQRAPTRSLVRAYRWLSPYEPTHRARRTANPWRSHP